METPAVAARRIIATLPGVRPGRLPASITRTSPGRNQRGKPASSMNRNRNKPSSSLAPYKLRSASTNACRPFTRSNASSLRKQERSQHADNEDCAHSIAKRFQSIHLVDQGQDEHRRRDADQNDYVADKEVVDGQDYIHDDVHMEFLAHVQVWRRTSMAPARSLLRLFDF